MDGQTQNRGTILKVALAIALALLVIAGLRIGVPWMQRQTASPANVERQALADPAMGPLFAAMKESYP